VLVVRAAQTGAKGTLLKALLFLDMKEIYSEVCRVTFLDEFAKLRKVTIGFVVSVSVFWHGTTRLPLDGFS